MTTLTTQANRPTWLKYVLHGLAGLVALAFLAAGGTKLAGVEMHVQNFANWGYPFWFMYVTGTIEVIAAVLILLPKTRFYGAATLVAVMMGAVLTHIQAGELAMLPPPVILLLLSGTVAWLTRPKQTVA